MSDNKPQTHKGERDAERSDETPAAGPHAKPELTNPDLTPGAGSLPDERQGGDSDGGAG